MKIRHNLPQWLRPAVLLSTLAACLLITSPALADPSAATQKFFGFSGGGGGSSSSQPASCDTSKLLAQGKALVKEMSQLNDQSQAKLQELEQEQSQLEPGDTATGDQIQAEQTQLLQSTKEKLAELKAQQEAIKKATDGPSDQCKRDTVAQSAAEMRTLAAALNGGQLSATLNKVDATVSEINSLIPKLSAAGVNGHDIDQIKTSVAAVQKDSATLRSFFSAMSAQAASFVAQAQADPIGTFNAMQAGHGSLSNSDSSGASAAADGLVTNFTNLVNLFDKLSS